MKSSLVHRLGFLALLLFLPLAMIETAIAQETLTLTLSPESENVYTTETTEILARLTTSTGEPVAGQEIAFTADLGTVNPDRLVTDEYGEGRVTFTAPNESGVSHITATANGVSQTIEITVISTFQWIVNMILCVLSLVGGGTAAALYWRRTRRARQKGEAGGSHYAAEG